MTPREIVLLVFGVLAGACVGSFVNVLIHRLPRPLDEANEFGELWETNSVSWIARRGRCRDCGSRIAAYHPLVEFAVPAFGVLAWLVLGWGWRLPLVLWLVPVGVAIAMIDLRTFMVPTRLVWPAFFVAIAIAVAVALAIDHPAYLLNGLIGIATLAGPLFVIWFILPSGMGFGDVRLVTLLGWCVGFTSGRSYGGAAVLSLLVLAGAAVLGIVLGVVALGARGRKAKVPFGPSLLLAAYVCMLAAPQLLDTFIGVS